ncbi:toxin-antitoxin system HicB family antitoxin [Rhodococcus zopfii]|nr:toxin-antitoxin system HicB family antitoxin [Rhodococcus zopfii]
MTLRIPAELHEQLRNDAKDAKVALSQYVADLLALQAGRPDLAREIKAVAV